MGFRRGSILSPIIFTIDGADLEEWIKKSIIFSYADITSWRSSGKTVVKVRESWKKTQKKS